MRESVQTGDGHLGCASLEEDLTTSPIKTERGAELNLYSTMLETGPFAAAVLFLQLMIK